ncbi:DUF1801 domain-containing protein [Robiginitalea sp. IMCC43444]|uniref:DUF1801 domain-containing protein n=1 Tax=Robiginitalea sp. IMCC43444 TaxID=3459121 RepID=UPI0040427FCC
MQYKASTPEEYIEQIPEERKAPMRELRKKIRENLPKGFQETINYGMIGYVVPHSTFPDGYHCDPTLPLPFMHLASQKNYISLYHSGVYASKELLDWFTKAYKEQMGRKPDMGKSCIRFKKADRIPYELIGELCTKISVQEYIDLYKKNIGKS